MDGLRWILLVVGLLIIAGIYLADRLKRRAARGGVNRFPGEDDATNLSMSPSAADDGHDYQDALADLNQLLSENREAAAETDIDADIASAWEANEQAAAPAFGPADSARTTAASGDGAETAPSPQPEQLIIFYLKAPEGSAFAGPALFEALSAAGLALGEMGIYHDTDSSGCMIFSVANLFEPGTLDIDDPEAFSTRGVALFMQLPGPTDPQDAFERMLGKAEILAERLGGELQDDSHLPLDADTVDRIRRGLG